MDNNNKPDSIDDANSVGALAQVRRHRLLQICGVSALGLLVSVLIARGIAVSIFLTGLISLVAAFLLAYKHKIQASSFVLLSAMSAMLFALALVGAGLFYIAIIGYPCLLIFAALLGGVGLFSALITLTLVTTAANEHDLNQMKNLLHGDEEFISADAGYQGAEKREELKEKDVEWLIAERPGKVRALKKHPRKNKTAINIEYLKASIRAKVEHPFRIIKCQFGFIKARYKGLMKNDSQLAMLFTLANLFKVDQMLRRQPRSV